MTSIIKVVDFITPLQLEVVRDNYFIVAGDFLVSLEGILIEIPKGFDTDLASVPRLPIVYLSVGNIGHKAAVLHDYLYYYKLYDRKKCDQYFYHALIESGVSKLKAYPMYWGVRIGGSAYYNQERR